MGDTLLTAIDEEVERLRRERPGANPHRSDAVREILYRALIQQQRSVARG